MNSLVVSFGKKKRIVLLGILMMLNIAMFSLPGLPANVTIVTQKAPDTVIPDMQIIYSAEEIYDFLTLIGPEGREAYQIMHLTTDLVFPLVYGFFLFSITSYLLVRLGWHQYFIALFGVLAAVFDLAENTALVIITGRFPEFLPGLANLTPILSIGKFSLMAVSFLLIVFLSIKLIRQP